MKGADDPVSNGWLVLLASYARRARATLILPSLVAVPMTHAVDLDPVTTVMLFGWAAGIGWFLWRHP